MLRILTAAMVISIFVQSSAQARGASIGGNELKTVLSGRVLNLSTSLGTLPIHYRANGTMSGRSSRVASLVGYSSDSGRWWVRGGQLCQKWRKLFEGRVICYAVSKSGNRIFWRGGGQRGSAVISQ